MHPNPAFRPENTAESLALAAELGFGLLAVSRPDDAPLLSHLPFLLSEDGASAELHLVRSNPIARACTSAPLAARLAVQGPHSYVSPDWYGLEGQVPTWNYLAIHLTGSLTPLPEDSLPGLLERLSRHFEDKLLPKPPWSISKMEPESVAKLLRQIRPFRIEIAQVESTWKLGQNKPEAARLSAADHIRAQGFGTDPALLSALMRKPPG